METEMSPKLKCYQKLNVNKSKKVLKIKIKIKKKTQEIGVVTKTPKLLKKNMQALFFF